MIASTQPRRVPSPAAYIEGVLDPRWRIPFVRYSASQGRMWRKRTGASSRLRMSATAVLVGLCLSASLLYFSSAYIPMPAYLDVTRDVGITIGTLLLVCLGAVAWSRTAHVVPLPLLLTWGGFALACVVSSTLTHSLIKDSLELFWLVFVVPLCFFLCGSVVLRHVGFKTLLWGLAISHVLILLVTFSYDQGLRFRYQGLLGDPNQLGMVSLMPGLLVIFYTPLALNRIWQNKWRLTILNVLLLACLSLIIVSSHRTSLLTLLACLTIAILRYRQLRAKALIVLLPCIVAVGGLLASLDDGGQILNQLFEKQSSAISKGDILSGRQAIWQFAVQDLTAFGHGREYFTTNTNRLGAHNSFLHVVGTRGLIPAGILLVICGQSFYYSFLLCRNPYIDYDSSQGPLLITTAYWSLSMAEGMFGSLGVGLHICFLITLGYAGSVASTARQNLRLTRKARPPRESYCLPSNL
jgi:O-antigen ligase